MTLSLSSPALQPELNFAFLPIIPLPVSCISRRLCYRNGSEKEKGNMNAVRQVEKILLHGYCRHALSKVW